MRRLLLLVSVLVLVDTMLYAALTPLLAHFVRELHLGKGGAGVLVAAYAAGALLGGLPGGRLAARLGPRRAVLVGLALMGCASVGFALAGSFGTLLAARAIQGAGSSFTWAGAFSWLVRSAPSSERGELIGRAMGAAVFGELLGPVLGVAASALGRTSVFIGLASRRHGLWGPLHALLLASVRGRRGSGAGAGHGVWADERRLGERRDDRPRRCGGAGGSGR